MESGVSCFILNARQQCVEEMRWPLSSKSFHEPIFLRCREVALSNNRNKDPEKCARKTECEIMKGQKRRKRGRRRQLLVDFFDLI